MDHSRNRIMAAAHGLFWAIVPAFAGWLLIYCGAAWAETAAADAEEKLLRQIFGALAQLKNAAFSFPWLAMLVTGAAFGGLRLLAGKRKRAFLVAEILLFLPVVLGMLMLTEMNGIQLGALVNTFLPVLKEVL